jgi:hypothetical protein
MLTCRLFASAHINSEPRVAVSSTPEPAEAALHYQVGLVMFSRNNTYYTRTYYNESSCAPLTAVGSFTLISTDPYVTAVLDIAVCLQIHTKALFGTK